MIFKKRFILHFDRNTARKIHSFCKAFYIVINDFIVKTVGSDLFAIEDDIDAERYELFIDYFNLSELGGLPENKDIQEAQDKKSIITVKFPHLISLAIKNVCKAIHWKPEGFIEGIVSRIINRIIDDIKNHKYDFFDIYLHSELTDIVKSINLIYEKDLL